MEQRRDGRNPTIAPRAVTTLEARTQPSKSARDPLPCRVVSEAESIDNLNRRATILKPHDHHGSVGLVQRQHMSRSIALQRDALVEFGGIDRAFGSGCTHFFTPLARLLTLGATQSGPATTA
ncbi:MAG: hypothetical protein ACI9SE_002569 [Neolewinella sp.]